MSQLNINELRKYLTRQAAADQLSGSVLIAQKEKTILKEAFGLASKRFNVPNQIDTKFNLGSINKIFTKIAVNQLIEQGKMEESDLVGKFLPDFPSEIATKVTIDHLLTFRSGMGHYWNKKFEASIGKLRSVDDFIDLFIDDPLSFEPGSKSQYSNSGYVVLGKIIETVTGEDYYSYIRKHIYHPAGMINSDHYELDIPVPNLAIGYTKIGMDGHFSQEGTVKNNTFIIGTKGSPAGGGYSTVEDMLRFDMALQNNKLLSPKYTSKIIPTQDPKSGEKRSDITLAGGANGISAFFGKFFAQNYILILLSNYDPPVTQPIYNEIRTRLLG